MVGFGGQTTGQLVFGGDGESVIYPCHSLVVHMDIKTGTQRFYVGHTGKVGVGECPCLFVIVSVRTKYVLLHVVVLCFLQVFRSSNYAYIGRKGHRFQLCHQFLAIFLLGQDVVMSQMSLYPDAM